MKKDLESGSILTVFACAAILLPAHPSLQSVFLSLGIPSFLVSAFFATPVIYKFVSLRHLSRKDVDVLLLFCSYMVLMLTRGFFSSAFGEANFISSLRSILVLMPLALMCAMIASRDKKLSVIMIFILGSIAALHLCFILYIDGSFTDVNKITSFSSVDEENQNYQSTAFYIGLVGVGMACYISQCRGIVFMLIFLAILIITFFLGMVGARSSLVAMLASFVLLFFLYSKQKLVSIVCLATLLIVIFFGLSLVGVDSFQAIFDKLVVIDRFLIMLDDDDPSQRIRLFSSAVEMWLESPINFFFGGGLGAFPAFIGESEEGWYPHNFILESLAEGGVFAGLLVILIMLILSAKIIYISKKDVFTSNNYIGMWGFYSAVAFQFMGGVQSLWIPTFFMALFIFNN